MKWKSMLIIIVLNIFLMLGADVISEYLSLEERFQQLEQTIQTSLDLAIDSSVSSEELFSSTFQDKMVSSYGLAASSANSMTASTITLFKDGAWFQGNSYVLATYFNDNGEFPKNETQYNSVYGSRVDIKDIYEYLYGGVGEDYTNSALSWANRSDSTKALYASSTYGNFTHSAADGRKVNDSSYNASGHASLDDFKSYFDNIGYRMTTTSTVKVKADDYDDDGTNRTRFNVEQRQFPTLAQMGLKLSGFNEADARMTADNFQSSYKIGKASVGKSKTVYYLTPYSLGVTYVPVSILKPMFIANLDTQVRLNKISSGDVKEEDDALKTLEEADGCVETSVYKDLNNPQKHVVDDSEWIVNDGNVEYDLNTASVKVDYFYVDFYDNYNRDIVGRIEGCISGYNSDGTKKGISQSALLDNTVQALKKSDTSYSYYKNKGQTDVMRGYRIVARVSCKIKVHVLYKSPIIQWAQYKFNDAKHYDIRGWDAQSQNMYTDTDGTWYQYTTYYAVTR